MTLQVLSCKLVTQAQGLTNMQLRNRQEAADEFDTYYSVTSRLGIGYYPMYFSTLQEALKEHKQDPSNINVLQNTFDAYKGNWQVKGIA